MTKQNPPHHAQRVIALVSSHNPGVFKSVDTCVSPMPRPRGSSYRFYRAGSG